MSVTRIGYPHGGAIERGEKNAIAKATKMSCSTLLIHKMLLYIAMCPFSPPVPPSPIIQNSHIYLDHDKGAGLNVAFAPDGKTVVTTTSSYAKITLWNTATGKELRSWKGFGYSCASVAFTPDGKLLAVTFAKGPTELWNTQTWEINAKFPKAAHSDSPAGRVIISPNGKLLATANQDHTVRVWDLQSGEQVGSIDDRGCRIAGITFSPDGKTLAVGLSTSGEVLLWDVRTRKITKSCQTGKKSLRALAFSSDSRILATANRHNQVLLWYIRSGTRVRLNTKYGKINDIAFAPDCKSLAIAGSSSWVDLWDISTSKVWASLRSNNAGDVSCVEFSKDGSMLIAGGGTMAYLWKVPKRQ